MSIKTRILILRKIERVKWIEAVLKWAEFFLLVAVCNTVTNLPLNFTAGGDLMMVLLSEIKDHSWLLGVLFVSRSTKSILKVKRETLTEILKWIKESE